MAQPELVEGPPCRGGLAASFDGGAAGPGRQRGRWGVVLALLQVALQVAESVCVLASSFAGLPWLDCGRPATF